MHARLIIAPTYGAQMCVGVFPVCVCFNRPYRAYRQGRTRVGLTNQIRQEGIQAGRAKSDIQQTQRLAPWQGLCR